MDIEQINKQLQEINSKIDMIGQKKKRVIKAPPTPAQLAQRQAFAERARAKAKKKEPEKEEPIKEVVKKTPRKLNTIKKTINIENKIKSQKI